MTYPSHIRNDIYIRTITGQGFKLRATHETKMNAVSSRSHTVFTITVVQKNRITGETVQGKLNLIDLAGSERVEKSQVRTEYIYVDVVFNFLFFISHVF